MNKPTNDEARHHVRGHRVHRHRVRIVAPSYRAQPEPGQEGKEVTTVSKDLDRVLAAVKQCAKTMKRVRDVFDSMDCEVLSRESSNIVDMINDLYKETEVIQFVREMLTEPDDDSDYT